MQIDFSNLSQYSVIAYCQILLQRMRPFMSFRGGIAEEYYDALTSILATAARKEDLSGDDIDVIKSVARGDISSALPSTLSTPDYTWSEIEAIGFVHDTARIAQIVALLFQRGIFYNQDYYQSTSDATVITEIFEQFRNWVALSILKANCQPEQQCGNIGTVLMFITQRTTDIVNAFAMHSNQPIPDMELECTTLCNNLANISPLHSKSLVDVSKLDVWHFEVPGWISHPYGF